MEEFEREIKLIGEQNFQKLQNSNILVVGVGGVGGYVCEMLARCGIGKLTIIDFDNVSKSNINRQIIALHSTIGKPKVDVLKQRLVDINPNLQIIEKNLRLTSENTNQILTEQKFDYVVDAIDSIDDKIELICCCKNLNLNIISAMGAGNRIDIPQYIVCDIYKTQNDGLAKKVRKLLREREIDSLDVVCSTSKTLSNTEGVGSVAYQTSICGIMLSSYLINQIIKM